ncbi:TPA: hypothetical protein ACOFQG_002713, partial [Staphylococcus aureus]
YDNDSEKLTYQAIENETEVQQEKQNEHEESPSKAPEDRNLSSLDNQIPPLQEDESEMER